MLIHLIFLLASATKNYAWNLKRGNDENKAIHLKSIFQGMKPKIKLKIRDHLLAAVSEKVEFENKGIFENDLRVHHKKKPKNTRRRDKFRAEVSESRPSNSIARSPFHLADIYKTVEKRLKNLLENQGCGFGAATSRPSYLNTISDDRLLKLYKRIVDQLSK